MPPGPAWPRVVQHLATKDDDDVDHGSEADLERRRLGASGNAGQDLTRRLDCKPGSFGRPIWPVDLFADGLAQSAESHYLDSTGVEWLLATNKRFQEAGGKLIVHSFNAVMQQILKMMRMDLVLNLAKDEAAAMEMVNGASHGK